MDNGDKNITNWNKIAQVYNDKFMEMNLYEYTYAYFVSDLIQGSKVIELGCGPGMISNYIATHRPDIYMEGVDASQAMIRLARKNVPSAHFKVGDVRSLSLSIDVYQGIILGFVIPYIEIHDTLALLERCKTALLGDGLLYVSFVHSDHNSSELLYGQDGISFQFNFYNRNWIKDQLVALGFMLEKTYQIPYRRSTSEVEIHDVIIARYDQ